MDKEVQRTLEEVFAIKEKKAVIDFVNKLKVGSEIVAKESDDYRVHYFLTYIEEIKVMLDGDIYIEVSSTPDIYYLKDYGEKWWFK